LDNAAQVREEVRRITHAGRIPAPVVNEILRRVRLRRRVLSLEARRDALRQRYIRVFPNGDWGFFGTTQSEFTARDSALIDEAERVRRSIARRHRDPVEFHNLRLAIVDPLGTDAQREDAIRIAETTYTFEEGSELQTRTRWRRTRGFPQLRQTRSFERLRYEFVAVTVPGDIAANNIAAARTARNAVRANRGIFDSRYDVA
jgi:hypothetical protein